MSRLPLVTTETADAVQAELLTEVRRQLGRVPNLYAAMANSPATLRGYLGFRDALTGGELGARVREQLALLIAAENGCDYCVSAHTMRAGRMGMSDAEIAATRVADAADPHAAAILRLARDVLRSRGRVDDAAVATARRAGVTDTEFGEVVGHVALNVLSNYFNHLAQPELDFPPVAASGSDGVASSGTESAAGVGGVAGPAGAVDGIGGSTDAASVGSPMDSVAEGAGDAVSSTGVADSNGSMTSTWRPAAAVRLRPGYALAGRDGTPVESIDDVHIRFEGGFLHIRIADGAAVQTISAPAVHLITHPAES